MDQETTAAALSGHHDYEPHVGYTRQYWRDIILGVNDGLVSVFLLVAGVVGGGLDASQVLLTAIAGAVAGAISMAAGEFLATRSQEEVFDREIALEREHIRNHTDMEIDQLRGMFIDLGVHAEDLDATIAAFSRDEEVLLNAMKVLEFGIVDSERRSPYLAMVMSGIWFLVGSVPSVLAFLIADSVSTGFTIAGGLTAVGLFAVGAMKTRVTGTNPIASGAQNLVIAGVGGLVAYVIGLGFDTSIG
ncbi:MAG TPA: VIT1/CCC1 transporter family protein [Acidimicrobiia bacterium]|jgi:VIT1/CCC1 family predicted Fe2+/Mn2+ transporter